MSKDAVKEFEGLDSKVDQFEKLLASIDNIESKKKALWLEIYENAVTDRLHAYSMFIELHQHVKTDPNLHALHGPLLGKYLERMSKSNDQLIKLADLIDAAERSSQELNENDIYGAARQFGG